MSIYHHRSRLVCCVPLRRSAQRGVALVVALILLVVVTLVGLAAIGGTIMQNKAASNQYDRQIAFQSTAAALRVAQVAIANATATKSPPAGFEDCSSASGQVCLANPFHDPNLATDGGSLITVTTTNFNAGTLAAQQPQYVVQYLGTFVAPTPTVRQVSNSQSYSAGSTDAVADYYRITARSGNPATLGGRSSVVLQATYRN